MATHTPESVLTPDFAQAAVRMVASCMAFPILEDRIARQFTPSDIQPSRHQRTLPHEHHPIRFHV